MIQELVYINSEGHKDLYLDCEQAFPEESGHSGDTAMWFDISVDNRPIGIVGQTYPQG